MDREHLISELNKFKARITGDVSNAYMQHGSDFGQERFDSWRRGINLFLDENLPGYKSQLDEKLTYGAYLMGMNESDYDFFMRYKGKTSLAFIDSLILDIKNEELHAEKKDGPRAKATEKNKEKIKNDRVFIVHGHDEAMQVKAARFIEKLGFEAIILHEQANKGRTVIEKIESYTDVGFAIVLYTADDVGNTKKEAEKGEKKPRARQNVVFEHGYLMAKLSREKVVPLVSANDIELPSDISGIVYVNETDWQIKIAKEMKACGYEIDFNKII
jgi:predicted nucleotide-binding protein